MELEQRVKALEYEIKILKNEIQRTLLEIQEQVLLHYYPALRSDESAPSEAIIQSLDQARQKQASGANSPAPTGVKQVTLEQIRAAQGQAPDVEAQKEAVKQQLVEWVRESAVMIGGARVGKMLEVSARKSILPSEFKEALRQLIPPDKAPVSNQAAAANAIRVALKLQQILGRGENAPEVLALVEEAGLG